MQYVYEIDLCMSGTLGICIVYVYTVLYVCIMCMYILYCRCVYLCM